MLSRDVKHGNGSAVKDVNRDAVATLKNMEDEERLQLGPNTDWMSRLPVALHDVPLWDLAIPGKAEVVRFRWLSLHFTSENVCIN